MFDLARCRYCGSAGRLPVHLDYEIAGPPCDCCGHEESRSHRLRFCEAACLAAWLDLEEVARFGFPCRDCVDFHCGRSTGFFGGFEQNGACPTCGGAGRVKPDPGRLSDQFRAKARGDGG